MMRYVRLKNIGPIEEVSIPIGGLTFISGESRTGKTSACKALVSLSNALYDVDAQYRFDIKQYVYNCLQREIDNCSVLYPLLVKDILSNVILGIFGTKDDSKLPMLKDYIPIFYKIFYQKDWSISDCDKVFLESLSKDLKFIIKCLSKNLSFPDWIERVTSELDRFEKEVIKISKVAFVNRLREYQEISINRIMNNIFHGEFHRLDTTVAGEIKVTGRINGSDYHRLTLKVHDSNINVAYYCDIRMSSVPVYYLDGSNVFDATMFPDKSQEKRIYSMYWHVMNHLCSGENNTIFEDVLVNIQHDRNGVYKQLSDLMPEELNINKDIQECFVCASNGTKYNVKNLTRGELFILTLRELFRKRIPPEESIIIIDDYDQLVPPDSELREVLASIFTDIIKKCGINIIVITEHPWDTTEIQKQINVSYLRMYRPLFIGHSRMPYPEGQSYYNFKCDTIHSIKNKES